MALSCSKEAGAKKEKKFMDLSLLPWDVLSLINGHLYSNNTQYLQDNRKDWVEKQDRNRVARQFDWMSVINSERFVEGERDAILDRERNWMKLLAEWLLVSSDYLVPTFPSFSKIFYPSQDIPRISPDSKCLFWMPSFVSRKAYLRNDRLG